MNKRSPPLGVENGGSELRVSGGEESSSTEGAVPVVEKFYERYQSLKANKDSAPAIDIDEIRHVFDFFDENHDGLITKEDLHKFMGRLGLKTTDDEISSMVQSADVNEDGSVDFQEFVSLYRAFSDGDIARGEEECEEDMKEAFLVFDKDADGFISPSELQDVLVNLGIDEGESLSNCEKMIQSVDADGDGKVDFGEFKKMMSGDFSRRI